MFHLQITEILIKQTFPQTYTFIHPSYYLYVQICIWTECHTKISTYNHQKAEKKTLISNRGVHQHLPLSSTCTTSSPPTNRQNLPHQCHFHKLFWPLQIRWELSSWAVSADLHLHPFPCWCCRENRSSLSSAWEIWWCPFTLQLARTPYNLFCGCCENCLCVSGSSTWFLRFVLIFSSLYLISSIHILFCN